MSNESENSSGISSDRARDHVVGNAEEMLVWRVSCLLDVQVDYKSGLLDPDVLV